VGNVLSNISRDSQETRSRRPYFHVFDDDGFSGLLNNYRKKGKPSSSSSCSSRQEKPSPPIGLLSGLMANNDAEFDPHTQQLQTEFHGIREYLQHEYHNQNPLQPNEERNDTTTCIPSSEQHSLSSKIRSLRKRRKVSSAHRLSGISVVLFPKNNATKGGCIGARLDVVDDTGKYAANYHVLFELVKTCCSAATIDKQNTNTALREDSSFCSSSTKRQKYEVQACCLKLGQHTLPNCISTEKIFENHFGGGNTSKTRTLQFPAHADGTVYNSVAVSAALRKCVGELYDAVHAYVMRYSMCTWLKKREQQQELASFNNPETKLSSVHSKIDARINKRSSPYYTGVAIQNVMIRDNAYDDVTFDLLLLLDTNDSCLNRTITVKLSYRDQFVAIPTKVHLAWIKNETKKTTLKNDEDDENHENKNRNTHHKQENGLFLSELDKLLQKYPLSEVVDKFQDIVLGI